MSSNQDFGVGFGPLTEVAFLPLPEMRSPAEIGSAIAFQPSDSFSIDPSRPVTFYSDREGFQIYTVRDREQTAFVALPAVEHAKVVAAYGADQLPQRLHARVASGDRRSWKIHAVSEARRVVEVDRRTEPGGVSSGVTAHAASVLGRLRFATPAWRLSFVGACLNSDSPWMAGQALDLSTRAERAEEWFGVDRDSFITAFMEHAAKDSSGADPLLAYLVEKPILPAEEPAGVGSLEFAWIEGLGLVDSETGRSSLIGSDEHSLESVGFVHTRSSMTAKDMGAHAQVCWYSDQHNVVGNEEAARRLASAGTF